MTHPWDEAAEAVRQRRAQEAANEAAAQAAQNAPWQRFQQELDALVASVAPGFDAFIKHNGPAAEHLLQAHGSEHARIIFGTYHGDSHYTAVYFGIKGLTYEAGPGIAHSGPIKSLATAEQAVRHFASFGDGYDYQNKRVDPAKVRNIEAWFIHQMKRFEPK